MEIIYIFSYMTIFTLVLLGVTILLYRGTYE